MENHSVLKNSFQDLCFENLNSSNNNEHLNLLYKLQQDKKNLNLRTNFTSNFDTKNIYNEREVYCYVPKIFDILFGIKSIDSKNIKKIELVSDYFNNLQILKINEEFLFPLIIFQYSQIFVKITFNSKENIPQNININFDVGYLNDYGRRMIIDGGFDFSSQLFNHQEGFIEKILISENVEKVFVDTCENKLYSFSFPEGYYFKILNTYDQEIDIVDHSSDMYNPEIIHTNLNKLQDRIINGTSLPIRIFCKNNFTLEFIPYLGM